MASNKQYVFGLHAVTAILDNDPKRVTRLLIQSGRQDQKMDALQKQARAAGVAIEHVSRQELDQLTQEAVHQGVAACCQRARQYSEADIVPLLNRSKKPLVLLLDGVQDPHNLGACFRSADAAGVTLIIAPRDKSASITPVVAKVACGATETVPFIQVTNLVRAMEQVKEAGVWIYGAAGEAEQTIYQMDFTGPAAIVMGAEGSGLRRLTREHCDGLIKIPMLGTVASLNVSVATGIILFEVQRQRFDSAGVLRPQS